MSLKCLKNSTRKLKATGMTFKQLMDEPLPEGIDNYFQHVVKAATGAYRTRMYLAMRAAYAKGFEAGYGEGREATLDDMGIF